MRITLTHEQIEALDHVLGCVYDNERDKGTDGIGHDMLESLERYHAALQTVEYRADSTEWLWIYEASDRPTPDRIIPGNGYEYRFTEYDLAGKVIGEFTSTGKYPTIDAAYAGWCHRAQVDPGDFFVQIEDHHPIYKHWSIPFHIAGLVEFFIDCYGDLVYYADEAETQERNAETVLAPVRAQLLMSDPIETSVLRFAIEALRENWTEYYRDQIPDEDRRQELECLQRIAENIRDADQIKLMVAQKMEEN